MSTSEIKVAGCKLVKFKENYSCTLVSYMNQPVLFNRKVFYWQMHKLHHRKVFIIPPTLYSL